jgi:hypothetical protein
MANEFSTTAASGLTLYLILHDAEDYSKHWRDDTNVFETADSDNWAAYSIAMTEVGTSGTYVADFPAEITDPGRYQYVVYLTSGAEDPSDPIYATGEVEWDGSQAVDPEAPSGEEDSWVTLEYVKISNGWSDTTDYDEQIDLLIPEVCEGVNKYLGRRISAGLRTEIRNGQGQDWIRAFNPPINSLTSVTVDFNGTNPTVVDGADFVYQQETGIIKSKPTASIRYGFAEGFQNVKLIYNGGYATIPLPIKRAVSLVIRKLIELGDPDRLVTTKGMGNRVVKYEGVVGSGDLSDPLFGDARRLLEPYRIVRYI